MLQDPAVLESRYFPMSRFQDDHFIIHALSAPHVDPEMWKKWMTKIESKGFFEGTEKGTKDYNDRVVRALGTSSRML